MTNTRSFWAAGALVATTAAVGAWGYLRLPQDAMIAIHFGLNGQPNGFAPKLMGLALMPAIAGLVIGLLALLPRLRPERDRVAASSQPYGTVMITLAGVFLITEIALVGHALKPDLNVTRLVSVAVAATLILIGNVLGKVRRNALIGIRTSWALGDDLVWDKTHRFTGRLMVAGGAVLGLAAIFAPTSYWLFPILIATAAVPPGIGVFYSANLARRSR